MAMCWIRDMKTSFFHKFSNQKKSVNMICNLKNEDEVVLSIFEDLERVGVAQFRNIFKEKKTESMDKFVRLAQLYPSFVKEDENRKLM